MFDASEIKKLHSVLKNKFLHLNANFPASIVLWRGTILTFNTNTY